MRHGSSRSSVLFNGYIQKAFDEVREKLEEVGGTPNQEEKFYMLFFVGGMSVFAENEKELVDKLMELKITISDTYNMNTNNTSTKIMVVSRYGTPTQYLLGVEQLETVKLFSYLGSRLTVDRSSKSETISRIQCGIWSYNRIFFL